MSRAPIPAEARDAGRGRREGREGFGARKVTRVGDPSSRGGLEVTARGKRKLAAGRGDRSSSRCLDHADLA